MGRVKQLTDLLAGFRFEEAFREVLGWPGFRHFTRLAIPDVGPLPAGWPTRATRERIAAAPRIFFDARGVARLAHQPVIVCEQNGGYTIAERRRRALARRLAQIHYRPIIVFVSRDDDRQDWTFPALGSAEYVHFVEFPCERVDDVEALAAALIDLEINAENSHWIDSPTTVFRTIDRVRDALLDSWPTASEERFCRRFARYGEPAVALARRAYRSKYRSIEHCKTATVAAQGGAPEAVERFVAMFMALVLLRADAWCQSHRLHQNEFGDYVSAGVMGLLAGLRRYDPGTGFAPSTLLFYHVDRGIQRQHAATDYPLHIPVYVQERLWPVAGAERRAFDLLAQREGRVPDDTELLRRCGLTPKDFQIYGWFEPERLARNRVRIDDLDDDALDPNLIVRQPHEHPWSDEDLELLMRIHRLNTRERDMLFLRYGVGSEPTADGMTLEELATHFQITRERVRQILVRIAKRLRNADPIPLGPLASIAAPPSSVVEGATPSPWIPPPRVPAPPRHVRKANQYIRYLLDVYGDRFSPAVVYAEMRIHFPQSIITLNQIEYKYRMRGFIK